MRSLIQSFLFLLLLFFVAFQESQAQDSSLVKWTSGTINQANNSILIKLKGEIKDNWHVYAFDSVDGLSGITFSTLDSSIQIKSHEITTQSISYSDPVFEGRKKETYQQKIELSILVSYSGAVPEAIKIPINYELGKADQFTTEEQVIKIILDSSQTSNAVLLI